MRAADIRLGLSFPLTSSSIQIVDAGEAFFEEGEEGENMYIVESGDVEAEVDAIGVIRTYRPG